MLIEVEPNQVIKGIGYAIGGAAAGGSAAMALFSSIKRMIGTSGFQASAGHLIQENLTTQKETKELLSKVSNHIDTEKEMLKELLSYSKESAKCNAIMVTLLEAYIKNG